ncbi:CD209 antigen-like protein E [Sardina pilchardus]|uniref:CD209 antigen-like protein E n=1 Tax=Sardina pilchardus TaxID=27697 RepID=UPI002E14863C
MSSHHKKEHIPKHDFVENHNAAAGPDDVICDTRDIDISLESGNNESVPSGSDPGSPMEVASRAETNAGACAKLSYTSLLHGVAVLMLAAAVAMAVLYVLKDQSYRQTHNLLEEQLQIIDGLSKEVTALHCEMKKMEDGWTNFSGKWYHFSLDSKNWTESRDNCITRGGDLAIIENEEEKGFVLAQGAQWWVGLTDSEEEGTWLWVDNTPHTDERFTPWAYKQPDNWSGAAGDPVNGEDCGLLQSSGLNDVTCFKKFKSICGWNCRV